MIVAQRSRSLHMIIPERWPNTGASVLKRRVSIESKLRFEAVIPHCVLDLSDYEERRRFIGSPRLVNKSWTLPLEPFLDFHHPEQRSAQRQADQQLAQR